MLGAIAGDIIGSVFEGNSTKKMGFNLFVYGSRFTDDSVMTVATAHQLLFDTGYIEAYQHYGVRYPDAGYGGHFKIWLRQDEPAPYNSWGNGSAMRASPIGFAGDSLPWVLDEAKLSAEVSHNHPEGIKGAQAAAVAVYLAKEGKSKDGIKSFISEQFGYDLNRRLDDIRPEYFFDVSCQGSVPESIIAFLESTGYEDCVRKAVSLGGDSDTQACIAGGIAQAFYGGVPQEIEKEVYKRLPDDLRSVLDAFNQKYGL